MSLLAFVKINLRTGFIILLIAGTGACAPATRNIDMDNDMGPAVMGLDSRDFEQAASDSVASLLQSGSLNRRDGGRYVLAISRIINDTTQRINTDQLVKKNQGSALPKRQGHCHNSCRCQWPGRQHGHAGP